MATYKQISVEFSRASAILGSAIFFSLWSHDIVSAATITAESYDYNGDSYLQEDEWSDLCIYVANDQTHKKFPTGNNREIQEEKIIVNNLCSRKYSSFMRGNSITSGYPVKRANEVYFSTKLKPIRFLQFTTRKDGKEDAWIRSSPGILLRRKYDDIRIHQSLGQLGAAEGALFAYSHDFENNSDTYQVNGNLSLPIFIKRNEFFGRPTTVHLDEAVIVPSISYDRLKNEAKPTNDVDSLSFRVGSEWRIKHAFFSTQYFWFSPVFTTDSTSNTKIFTGEAEWRPVARNLGIGQALPRDGNSFFYFRWKPRIHAEWGYVANDGGNANIRDKKQFARLGPKIDVDIWAGDRTKFYANWEYLIALTGKSKSQQIFNSGVEFTLSPDNPNWTLTLDYKYGKIPLVLQKTESMRFGIGLKF